MTAAVYSIGVTPAYRGKGIATRMLQRALTVIQGSYPLLRLYVMEGNDAESVDYNLGFMPGVQEVQSMRVPRSKNAALLSKNNGLHFLIVLIVLRRLLPAQRPLNND